MVGKKNQQVHIAEHVSYFLAKIDNFFCFSRALFSEEAKQAEALAEVGVWEVCKKAIK